mmetsp:Transcript_12673/g.39037  ORF Transcript_12673/g.39037 Transcript_12673/m.39037 type:complete len:201 (-) Transcript_12673:219-821(-)
MIEDGLRDSVDARRFCPDCQATRASAAVTRADGDYEAARWNARGLDLDDAVVDAAFGGSVAARAALAKAYGAVEYVVKAVGYDAGRQAAATRRIAYDALSKAHGIAVDAGDAAAAGSSRRCASKCGRSETWSRLSCPTSRGVSSTCRARCSSSTRRRPRRATTTGASRSASCSERPPSSRRSRTSRRRSPSFARASADLS